jgi:uncharacterized protein YcnI
LKKMLSASALGLVVLGASPAFAHVTVQPNEAITGAFSRFVVRVPNERPDASTVRVDVEFPALAYVSFEPKDGWRRVVEEGELEQPVEAFGNEITEGVISVSWRGGEIAPGEFDEFGFSARMPDAEERLVFRAYQHYDSGEVVEWIGAEDSEEPAAGVTVYDIGAEEGEGQLGVLARVSEAQAAGGEDPGAGAAPGGSPETSENGAGDTLPLVISVVALLLAASALWTALRKPAKASDV